MRTAREQIPAPTPGRQGYPQGQVRGRLGLGVELTHAPLYQIAGIAIREPPTYARSGECDNAELIVRRRCLASTLTLGA